MEERISSEAVYPGKLFQVFRDKVSLPGGRTTAREIVRHPGSVAIVPLLNDGRIILVRQFRYATGQELWEIPAGTRDRQGESLEETAHRELAEEAGFKSGRMTRLGQAYLVPGWGDELMTWFLAEDLSPTRAEAEPDESFQVNPFDPASLRALLSSGGLQDAKTLLGLAWCGVQIPH